MKANLESVKENLSQTSVGSVALELVGNIPLKEQGIDSLDLLDFYLNLEEAYNIKIADEDIEKLNSLDEFVNYINERVE